MQEKGGEMCRRGEKVAGERQEGMQGKAGRVQGEVGRNAGERQEGCRGEMAICAGERWGRVLRANILPLSFLVAMVNQGCIEARKILSHLGVSRDPRTVDNMEESGLGVLGS